ncbi:MAG TPA: glycosyltransferase, partial [Acidimicrobiales bacterium]|nr:glycosyltransferase [Acidimicrobiales bacterium]
MPSPVVSTFHHRHVDLSAVLAAKGDQRISVVIPARDEEQTLGRIVRTIRRELVEQRGLVDEVVVVDDGSEDNTFLVARDAGARVVRAREVLSASGPGAGKGEAMWKGLEVAEGDIVAYCDADIRNFGPRFIVGL